MNFFFQFRMNSHLKNKRNRPEIFRLSRLEITNSHFDDFDENEWDPNLSAQYLNNIL